MPKRRPAPVELLANGVGPGSFLSSTSNTTILFAHGVYTKSARAVHTEAKKHSPNTGARAHNTLQVTRQPHRGAC